MSRKAGTLLWNRIRIPTFAPGDLTVDTGLTQVNKSFNAQSPNEPPLGILAAPPGPPDGTLPASRVQVIPLAPLSKWAGITHGEPFVDPSTGTVKVTFTNSGEVTIADMNALFWDPHTLIGPGDADTYNPLT